MVYVLSWGSPVGIALFLFLMGAGAGIFMWGLSHLVKAKQMQDKAD